MLIQSINRTLAGWANYFRHGVSKAAFIAIGARAGPDDSRAVAAGPRPAGAGHRAAGMLTPAGLVAAFGINLRLARISACSAPR